MEKHSNFLLFDSHSKDASGNFTPNGLSILLTFKNKKDLENHILTTYLSNTDINIQFETQNIFVETDVGVDFSVEYQKDQSRKRNSSEKAKEKDSQRKATFIATANCRQRNSKVEAKAKCHKRNSSVEAKDKCRKRKAEKKMWL